MVKRVKKGKWAVFGVSGVGCEDGGCFFWRGCGVSNLRCEWVKVCWIISLDWMDFCWIISWRNLGWIDEILKL